MVLSESVRYFWARPDICSARQSSYYWRKKIESGSTDDRSLEKYAKWIGYMQQQLLERGPPPTRGKDKKKRSYPLFRKTPVKSWFKTKATKATEAATEAATEWIPQELRWD